MKEKILTLQQMYKEGCAELSATGIPSPLTDAWYLLEYVTGIGRAAYYGQPERVVDEKTLDAYRECIQMRKKRIPLQHITGEQEFMGYSFQVNSEVLVPRQDTEVLVEEALKRIRPGFRVLDLCTGSGCILISLLKMAGERLKIEELEGIGADISKEALLVAEANAKKLGTEVTLLQSDLFERVQGCFDLMVSNPPYIPTAVIEELQEEVRLHDPYIALDGKEDGLCFYRRIARESPAYLKKGGSILLEIGCDQGESVPELLQEAGFDEIQVKKDLSGLDRVVSARYNKN